jgi:hypothetical protein
MALPGPKEPMLNGLPMSEVQRREKRGQIIDYSSRGISPTSIAMSAPKTGGRDVVNSSAQADRVWSSSSPKAALERMTDSPKLQRSMTASRHPFMRYRDFIDRHLARTSWTQNGKLNVLPLALILGLGVWLPVFLFFGFFALLLSAAPAVSAGVSFTGKIVASLAVGYFIMRKLTGKGESAS